MSNFIDIRCRPPYKDFLHYFNEMIPIEQRPKSFLDTSLELWFEDLRSVGISQAVVAGGINNGMRLNDRDIPPRSISNEQVGELVAQYADRIIGLGGIDPSGTFHNPLEEIDKCASLGLVGVFMEPGRALFGSNPADKRLYPIYEKLEKLDLCLNIQTSGPLGGDTIDYANPKYIDQIAMDFPNLRIICCHGCYPFVREIISVCLRRPNVYVAPDVYMRWPGTQDWVDAINFQGQLGYGRFEDHFIFGTAYPYMDLTNYMNFFNSLTIREEAKEKIFRLNALRALKLDNKKYPAY